MTTTTTTASLLGTLSVILVAPILFVNLYWSSSSSIIASISTNRDDNGVVISDKERSVPVSALPINLPHVMTTPAAVTSIATNTTIGATDTIHNNNNDDDEDDDEDDDDNNTHPNKFRTKQQQQNHNGWIPITPELESQIHCQQQNCWIENACVDRNPNIVRRHAPIQIQLFGKSPQQAQQKWEPYLIEHIKQRQYNNSNSTTNAETEVFDHVIGRREVHISRGYVNWTNTIYNDDNTTHHFPSWIDPHSTAVVMNRPVRNNCGHDLGDCVVPAFRLRTLFDASPATKFDDFYLAGRPGYCDKVFQHVTQRLIVGDVTFFHPNKTECYGKIYFGTRGFNYMEDNYIHKEWPHTNRIGTMERDLREFRDFHYRQIGISPSSLPPRDTILVMEKRSGSHLSVFGRTDEMVSNLTAAFSPHYRVRSVCWSDHTFSEQIDIMARTRAMISLPGSDIMNGVFVQDHTPIVLYCRKVENGQGFDTSNERTYWFDHLDYVDAQTEDCNSTNVSYRFVEKTNGKNRIKIWYTDVDFDSLKQRLIRLGLTATDEEEG